MRTVHIACIMRAHQSFR